MKRTWKFLLLAVLVFSFTAIVHANNKGDETIKLEASRGTVTFKHWAHQGVEGITCKTCHHTLASATAMPDKSCSDCHTAQKDGNRPSLKNAMHTNCKGCHKDNNKGPTRCNDCHTR